MIRRIGIGTRAGLVVLRQPQPGAADANVGVVRYQLDRRIEIARRGLRVLHRQLDPGAFGVQPAIVRRELDRLGQIIAAAREFMACGKRHAAPAIGNRRGQWRRGIGLVAIVVDRQVEHRPAVIGEEHRMQRVGNVHPVRQEEIRADQHVDAVIAIVAEVTETQFDLLDRLIVADRQAFEGADPGLHHMRPDPARIARLDHAGAVRLDPRACGGGA